MAQHRDTPQPPILPPERPSSGPGPDPEDWGADEATAIGMMLPPEAAAVSAEEQRRMASLSSLSLNKGVQTVPVNVQVARSSKLPWVLLLLVLGGGTVYIARTRDTPAPTAAPVAVQPTTPTEPARYGDLIASGYIAAKAPIVLAASTGGTLKDLMVDNGDKIAKGQIVAVIEDGPLRAELALANARLRDASRSLQRVRAFKSDGGATQKDLDAAIGAVEIAQGEVRLKAQQLEQTKIRSKINGTVLEVLARPGEALGTTTGIIRIADLSLLVAEADISEAELKTIVVGQAVEVTIDSQRDRPYMATVREISQQADRSRGTVLIRSYLDATTDGVLKPGMAVQVKVIREPVKPVPADAPVPAREPAAGAVPVETKDPAPAVTEPAVKEPAVTKPTVTKPAVTKPAVKVAPKAKPRSVTPKKKAGGLDI